MDWLASLAGSVEFWIGLSLIAAALPGPQTRVMAALFRAVAGAIRKGSNRNSGERP